MMMNSCELEQAERHAYISGDTKRAALLAEMVDLAKQVDYLQDALDELDDNRTD
jgi:hypothetical protein